MATDGSRFVYVGEALRSDGRLWTHVQDQLTSTALDGTEGACCPSFSPDGQAIAFRQDFVTKVIPFDGGGSCYAQRFILYGRQRRRLGP